MPSSPLLDSAQLHAFEQHGVLRIRELLSLDRVKRAREHVLAKLSELRLWRHGGWKPGDPPKPAWPDTGLGKTKSVENRHPDLEQLIDDPALLAVVEQVLEGAEFDRTIYRRPQILVTLPNANSDSWTIPTHWHVDLPRLASGRRPGIQMFACLDTVQSRGGGTLVIAGSHRLLNDGRNLRVKELTALLRREDFFRPLYDERRRGPKERADLLGRKGLVGDVCLEVVELTGSPGDIWLADLRTLHTASPNAREIPRLMATHRFVPASALREISEALGWER